MKFVAAIVMIFVTYNISAQSYIVIDKQKLLLSVLKADTTNIDTLFTTKIGCGINYGNKIVDGDLKTPEGTFSISQIQDSSKWRHNFNNGKGLIGSAYGPYFFRLKIPNNNTIGIHGTCFPESIGTRCSAGCIRLENSELLRLKPFVKVGMKCVILPDEEQGIEPAP